MSTSIMVTKYEKLRIYENSARTNSSKETALLGRRFAKEFLRAPLRKRAIVVALQGDLGSGKTTFLQGFARGLGVKEKILSPTFVIRKRFKIKDLRFKYFYHIDCYRLKGARDLYGVGWKEIIKNPGAIIVVEWADRVKSVIPKDAAWITFNWRGESGREIRESGAH